MDVYVLPFWKMSVQDKIRGFSVKIDENSHIGLHIKKKRLELGLRQVDLAEYFKINVDCLYSWENCLGLPQMRVMGKVIKWLGYNPLIKDSKDIGSRIKIYRQEHGLSHIKMGRLLGVDPATVSCWETGKYIPSKKNIEIINATLKRVPSEADLGTAEAQPDRNSLETGMVGGGQ